MSKLLQWERFKRTPRPKNADEADRAQDAFDVCAPQHRRPRRRKRRDGEVGGPLYQGSPIECCRRKKEPGGISQPPKFIGSPTSPALSGIESRPWRDFGSWPQPITIPPLAGLCRLSIFKQSLDSPLLDNPLLLHGIAATCTGS
jgi:hypothetical protein